MNVIVASLFLFLIAGCASTTTHDLGVKFKSIKSVWSDQPEIVREHSIEPIRMHGSELAPEPWKGFNNDSLKTQALKVSFEASESLARIYQRNSGIRPYTYFCDESPRVDSLIGLPEAFHEGKSINQLKQSDFKAGQTYYTYLRIEPPAHVGDPSQSFNLRLNPCDICFYLESSTAPYGPRLRSNVVVVPKAEILKAFKN